MKKYSFHSGQFTPNARYLFNQYEHLCLQSEKQWRCFYLLDENEECKAFIWFNFQDGIARSPVKAPFGSFEYHPDLALKSLSDFIEYVQSTLTFEGVKKIILKQSPDAYEHPRRAELNTLLLNHGFYIAHAEIGSVISIQAHAYHTLLNDWEQRKLKQARENNFRFELAEKVRLTEVYDFIKTCRAEKDYDLSMSLNDLQLFSKVFPDALKLFALYDQNQYVAACIAIQVSADILYTFYYDHAGAYKQYSPVVMLMEGIYAYCQQHHYQQLDLGTASLNGQPNFGLLTFKQHLGASPTSKLTFEKILIHD